MSYFLVDLSSFLISSWPTELLVGMMRIIEFLFAAIVISWNNFYLKKEVFAFVI